jgi:hypothetical protein
MLKLAPIALLAVVVLISAFPATLVGEEEVPEIPAGQAGFMENRCNLCHTIYAAGLGEPSEEEVEPVEGVVLPPDLSFVGSARTAEWLEKYLLKTEMIEGRKHKKTLKAEEQERGVLVAWLASLKAPEEESEAEGVEAHENKEEAVQEMKAEEPAPAPKAPAEPAPAPKAPAEPTPAPKAPAEPAPESPSGE